jgi:hypothetical protein
MYITQYHIYKKNKQNTNTQYLKAQKDTQIVGTRLVVKCSILFVYARNVKSTPPKTVHFFLHYLYARKVKVHPKIVNFFLHLFYVY